MDSISDPHSPPPSERWVTIHVDGVLFETRQSTLTRHSQWFQRYFETPDAPAVVRLDCNASMFEHIIKFMRRSIYPMFFDPKTAILDLVKYNELLEEARYLGVQALVHYVESGSYGFQRLKFPPYKPEALRVGGLVVSDETVKHMDDFESASAATVKVARGQKQIDDLVGGSEVDSGGSVKGSVKGKSRWTPDLDIGAGISENFTTFPATEHSPYLGQTIVPTARADSFKTGPLVDIVDYITGPEPRKQEWSSRKELLGDCSRKVGEKRFTCAYPGCDPARYFATGAACKAHIRAVHHEALAKFCTGP